MTVWEAEANWHIAQQEASEQFARAERYKHVLSIIAAHDFTESTVECVHDWESGDCYFSMRKLARDALGIP